MKIRLIALLGLAVVLLAACGGKSDAELQKAISDKLAAERVAGVTVSVKDGVATLAGEVADVTVRNKAESAAKSVEGVKSVDATKVTLKPLPTPSPAPADPMLQGKVD